MIALQLLFEFSQGLMISNIFSWTCWQFFYFRSSPEKKKPKCEFSLCLSVSLDCAHTEKGAVKSMPVTSACHTRQAWMGCSMAGKVGDQHGETLNFVHSSAEPHTDLLKVEHQSPDHWCPRKRRG